MLSSHSSPACWRHLLRVAVLLIVLWPLLFVTYPPFLDYYSHLARVHITANIDDFSEFYAINQNIPPNIALDVVVGALLNIVPIEMAGWLFLVSILLIQATGIWILNEKLTGRQEVPIGPLFGCAILYNSVMTMGFLGYLFGLGLMLWMVWLWLVIRERSWWVCLGLGTGAAVLLYFAHIVVLGIYGIVVVGYELQQLVTDHRKSLRRRSYLFVRSGLPFLLPALLYLTSFQGDTQLVQYAQHFFLGKLHAIAGTLNTGATPVALSIAGLAVLGALALVLGRPKLSTDMILPIGLLTLLFLFAPTTFGGGRYFDDRLALPVALLACSSIRVDFPARGRVLAVLSGLLIFLAVRGFDLSRDFSRFDAEVRQSLRLLGAIEPGSIVAVAIDTTHPEYSWSARGRANWHVASLAALHAPVFVATTHAQHSQHTMVPNGPPLTDLYAWQKEIPAELASGPQFKEVIASYRETSKPNTSSGEAQARRLYLLLLMPNTLAESAGPQAVVIGRTKWFLLFRLEPKGVDRSA